MGMSERKWFVWNPQGRIPTFEHPNEDSARKEAARLARLNSGQRFLVLKSVAEVEVNDLRWREFDDMPFHEGEIPF
jgi:hypothetical protein